MMVVSVLKGSTNKVGIITSIHSDELETSAIGLDLARYRSAREGAERYNTQPEAHSAANLLHISQS